MKRLTSMRSAAVTAFLLLAMLAAQAPAQSEDQALVIGVQRYQLARANTLRGCEGDARLMAGALKDLGFKVTLLLNEQATRAAILANISSIGARVGPSERFLLYFAGHGRDEPRMELMPTDSTAQGNGITPEELYQTVRAVPGRARTVVLDSCFSGAMRKFISTEDRRDFRPRYYAPAGSKSITARPASHQDTQSDLVKDSNVCYWTAAQGNEQALEGRFKGEYHGVFTSDLVEELKQDSSLPWGTLHAEVKGKVAETLGDRFHQHPTISPAYVQASLFDSKDRLATVSSTEQDPPTLWQDFNSDHVDPAALSLSLIPDHTAFELGEPIRLDVKIGVTGFLVVLDRNVDGKVYRLFPKGDVSTAQVEVGDVKRLPPPPSEYYTADEKGLEHVKALLFTTREKAAAVIDAANVGDEGVRFQGMKRLREARAPAGVFYTSEVTFSVIGKGENR